MTKEKMKVDNPTEVAARAPLNVTNQVTSLQVATIATRKTAEQIQEEIRQEEWRNGSPW